MPTPVGERACAPGSGAVCVGHLVGELYKSIAKVYVTHIPYRGSGPALNEVVAGQLPIVVDNLPSTLPFIKEERLNPSWWRRQIV